MKHSSFNETVRAATEKDALGRHSYLGRVAMFVAGGVILSACGGAALSNRDVSAVNGDIRAAEVAEATANPKAALHLKLAKDELAEAQRLANDGDDDKARLALERARADAELAIVLTKEAQAQQEAQEALEKINRLSQN